MRAICNPCPHKDTCAYVKDGNERDCIDVQTSDYGYEEAIEKACEWLSNTIHFAIDVPIVKEGQKVIITESYLKGEFIKSFRSALEL